MTKGMKKNGNETKINARLGFYIIAVAELYLQKPNDPMFKKFSPKALKGIQEFAKVLKERKEKDPRFNSTDKNILRELTNEVTKKRAD